MSFYLYRSTPNGNEVLSLINSNKLTFAPQNGAPLSFVGQSGHQANTITTGKIYFPVISQQDGIYYIYATSDRSTFALAKSNKLTGRLFIYIPPGNTYIAGCNLNGQFFVYGSSLDNSVLADFNSQLLDIIWLVSTDGNQNIIARDCIPNCQGKKCTDNDGCGQPCGCSEDQICLNSGICQGQNLTIPICLDESQYPNSSGTNAPINCAGFCFGHCPNGYQCVRDKYGNNGCIPIQGTNTDQLKTVFIVAFIIMSLVLIITILWLFGRKRGQYEPPKEKINAYERMDSAVRSPVPF